jgi:hypothetical protein
VAGQRVLVERRKNERVPLAVPVFVRGRDSDGKEFLEFATALNISAGGALLATRRYLPSLSTISLEIPSAPLPRNVTLPRAVRRLRARLLRVSSADGYHLWALKFSVPLISRPDSRGKVHSLE